ncbi:uncharacterized protein EDB91DRAFT_1234153 [Suillus paluster]|uniref:uncharacterized protein n=1 Tax=Suillus paluster TaxID=48578 RepID=UPI001B87F137|nr:uncharacterized protein EDB91DRAFT_1234153 [Suillus paluster]KAG1753750.1 hypothetical protein EDB91DRAFT_1234153 [Suillus paluster]
MNGTGGFAVPQQQPQPYSPPSGGQIAPGSITYTTSTSADGQVTYHPFSYQTAQGVVHGIQWVPAEATQILPAGAQPANAEFAASWNRSGLSREDERDLEKWHRSEEKRRKKEEKASLKNISKQFERDEMEIRMARERDTHAIGRKRSFYGEAPPPVYPPGTAAYGAYSSADLDRRFGDLDIDRKDSTFGTRPRKHSHSSAYAPPGAGAYSSPPATYTSPTGYPTTGGAGPYNRAASPYRPVGNFSTSPNVRPQEFPSTYPGGPDPIARAASPYAARAPSPYAARAPSPNPYGARAAPSPYGARATSPMPQVPRAASPMPPVQRAASPYARPLSRAPSPYHGQQATSTYPPPQRAPSPFVPPPQIHSQVYPRGHVLEGQPMAAPRSRAPSPMPGGPIGSGFPSSPRMPNTGFSSSPRMPSTGFSSSPRMPNTGFPSSPQSLQLAAPEAFSRPPNAAQPYTPFSVMRIQDMDKFYDQIPRMPLVLDTHDVYHQDWIRFMNDLALGWAGKLPISEFSRGGNPPKRSSLVADLINLWNDSFFRARRVEVVLYKGRERRSGPHAGSVDNHLPMPDFDSDSDLSDSSSLSSESEDDRYYGRGVDLADSKRRRREKKEEKKWRKKEKKLRKKVKERERQYAVYLTYVAPRDMPAPGGHNYYG